MRRFYLAWPRAQILQTVSEEFARLGGIKLNTRSTIDEEVDRYLRTGETDPHREAWPGAFSEREKFAHHALRGALVREVRRLTEGRSRSV
jgi:hypothetical protein